VKAEKAVCDAAEAAAEQPRRDEAEKAVWDSGIEQQYTRADIKELNGGVRTVQQVWLAFTPSIYYTCMT